MQERARQPLRILVAEDEPELARLYSAYGEKRGHNVAVARDGAEALAAALEDPPDLLLLDVSMPKLDGRDVLRQLRANPRTANVPIVAVTAYGGDQNMRDLLLELGAADVFEKPVDLAIAFTKVERLVKR
jgi:CheY-like chemotaxis protein